MVSKKSNKVDSNKHEDQLPSVESGYTETDSDQDSGSNAHNISNDIVDEIVRYVKLDDIIRKKQKEFRDELQVIKVQKKDLEANIITHLERAGEDYFTFGTGKLIRAESRTKGAIKPDFIKNSVIDCIKRDNLIEDEQKCIELVNNILTSVDRYRPVNNKVYIKRTNARKTERKPKGNKGGNKE